MRARLVFGFSLAVITVFGVGAAPVFADPIFHFGVTEIGLQNYLESDLARGTESGMVDARCKELGAGDCDFALMQSLKDNAGGHFNLPYCSTPTQDFCVEGLKVYAEGSVATNAIFDFEIFGDHPKISANIAHGLPEVGQPLIFRAPGIKSVQGSDEYMVQAALDLSFNAPDYMASLNDVKISVMPVGVATGPGRELAGYFPPEDFKSNVRASVSVRLPKKVGGWFKGRISNAHIDITNFNDDSYVLSVDAKPVQVPEAQIALSEADYEPFQQAVFGQNVFGPYNPNGGSGVEGDGSFGLLEAMRPYASDTAYSIKTAWSLTSFAGSLKPECAVSSLGLVGLVASNATIYTGQPPQQDETGLHYKVASFHYLPDGVSVAQGSYDLLIREDVARCIYNLPADGDLAATVTVAEDGTSAPASVQFQVEGGFVHFSASDFHFSQPVITTTLKVDGSGSHVPVVPVLKTFKLTSAKITGVLANGKTLKFAIKGVPAGSKIQYEWFVAGKKIARAGAATLKISKSLVSKKISARVTLTKTGYKSKQVTVRFN